ncbi:hypothetical protein B484DRAFT_453781 [Ochromonadaceae sp. CCMP2298]|nr:hypothetical protein B484DRAFT_453781 [Ochromonadaceae sp. CCMP2298]
MIRAELSSASIVAALLLCLLLAQAGAFDWKNVFSRKPVRKMGTVVKPSKAPLLRVRDPYSQCTIHLVGVSHGAATSAELVKETILKVKPATVVVELCDERYLSICLESRIRPNGNASMLNVYNEKLRVYDAKRALDPDQGPLAQFKPFYEFLTSQGPVVGSFVAVGMVVGGLQRAVRGVGAPIGDEFTTAMRAAEQLNVPVRMGDAQQSATLRSVKKIISRETFDPRAVWEGAQSLAFSAFGMRVDPFPTENLRPPAREELQTALDGSNWVNIPAVYVENKSMINSLLPLIIISLFTSLLPLAGQAADLMHYQEAVTVLGSAPIAPIAPLVPDISTISAFSLSASASASAVVPGPLGAANALVGAAGMQLLGPVLSFLTDDLPPGVEGAVNTAVDVFSLLLLIRMAKIIGADRDRIIASKIQDACKEFPGSDVVVVVGMLHCNGVARWLLSGQDPLAEALMEAEA